MVNRFFVVEIVNFLTIFLFIDIYTYFGDIMLNVFNSILWSIAIVFLVGGGLYLTFYLRGAQFNIRGLLHCFRSKKDSSISSFQTLTMSLAARIGVGSLAGIALAIYIGGPGTVFWIWISSIITAVNSFSESVLGVVYHERDDISYKGGPAYYIDKGLGKKSMARFYAILIIFAYIVGFMSIQANTISVSLNNYYGFSPYIVGIILAIITAFSIFKGVKGIVSLTSKLVPIMGFIYIFLSVYVIFANIKIIPDILLLIIKSAFDVKSFGVGVLSSFVIGIQRGVFSTEAGLGSGAIASSATDTNSSISVGFTQVVGVYFTSFIICTATAFIILTSDYLNLSFDNINGIEITQYALSYHLGNIGILILIFSILSFAFSTIIAGYYYGESNLKYLSDKVNEKHIFVLKIVTVLLLIIGSVVKSSLLWALVDILVALMAIVNMYAVIKLKRVVKDELKYYSDTSNG